jgi:hypothetical protein
MGWRLCPTAHFVVALVISGSATSLAVNLKTTISLSEESNVDPFSCWHLVYGSALCCKLFRGTHCVYHQGWKIGNTVHVAVFVIEISTACQRAVWLIGNIWTTVTGWQKSASFSWLTFVVGCSISCYTYMIPVISSSSTSLLLFCVKCKYKVMGTGNISNPASSILSMYKLKSSSLCCIFQLFVTSCLLGSDIYQTVFTSVCILLLVWEVKFHTQTNGRSDYTNIYALCLCF